MQVKKISALVFISHYLPGFKAGGPIRSIANMVDSLSDDIDFSIVCSDRDLGDDAPYPSITHTAWNQIGNARVFFLDQSVMSYWSCLKIIRQTPYDVIYLNSFFSRRFSLFPLLANKCFGPKAPTVIAPRGELSSGALRIKPWRKAAYQIFLKSTGLFKGLTWQGSSRFECDDIRSTLKRFNGARYQDCILEAPDLPAKNYHSHEVVLSLRSERSDGTLRVCFVARIAPIKNLTFALSVLSRVKCCVIFDIYGPKEDHDYWVECERLISELPRNVTARYHGHVAHAEIARIIRDYDLLFVPSLSENFGHVFIEALSVGTPILLSDQTPWRSLAVHSVGWDLSLHTPDRFVEAIESAASMNSDQWHSFCLSCISYARMISDDIRLRNSSLHLFRHAIQLHSAN